MYFFLRSDKIFKTYMHGHKYGGFYPVLKKKCFLFQLVTSTTDMDSLIVDLDKVLDDFEAEGE